jgi:hypothetical protein
MTDSPYPKIEVVREHYRIQTEKRKAAENEYLFDRYQKVFQDQNSYRHDIAERIQHALDRATEQGEIITHMIYRRWGVYMDHGTIMAVIKILGPELEAAGYQTHPVEGGVRIDWLVQVEPETALAGDKVLP